MSELNKLSTDTLRALAMAMAQEAREARLMEVKNGEPEKTA